MDFKKARILRSKSLADQVAEFISGQITRGAFLAGDVLPSETVLAGEFGVSRTVIREALARLKYDGLLESQKRTGAVILDHSERRTFRLDEIDIENKDDLGRLYEFRGILEKDIAALAAERHSESQMSRLSDALLGMERAIDEGSDGSAEDLAFHRILAEAARNSYLADFLKYLDRKIWVVIHDTRRSFPMDPELARLVLDEHREVYEAVAGCDAEKARSTMLRHIRCSACRQGVLTVHQTVLKG